MKKMAVLIKKIKPEKELNDALILCYRILGEDQPEFYRYEAWHERWKDGLQPMVYAEIDGEIVSAVLGRAENEANLTIGFVACHENYRRQGITKRLMGYFEESARKKGFQYITLGSKEDAFYKDCGYHIIFETNGQNIFQKAL